MILDAKSKVFVVMNQQTEWDFRASMYKHKGEFRDDQIYDLDDQIFQPATSKHKGEFWDDQYLI